MSFFAEVAAAVGLDAAAIATGYQIINYGGKYVYVEGFKRLTGIGENEITLALKDGVIKVTGRDLSVRSMEAATVIIEGEILSTEAVKNGN
ncbi:MAG: YabP/YqfC family sporulation protein [Clostridiales bacterium]|jgi:sporulation protein YqfC|nr:YabP/YqfC family sporulation protein [Clostridiales bacterium]